MSIAVALDMFPADVTLPSGMELHGARVWVADGRVLVYIREAGQAKLFFDEELLSGTSRVRSAKLEVADGTISVDMLRHCGCGNPLKRFNPWPAERRVRVAL